MFKERLLSNRQNIKKNIFSNESKIKEICSIIKIKQKRKPKTLQEILHFKFLKEKKVSGIF